MYTHFYEAVNDRCAFLACPWAASCDSFVHITLLAHPIKLTFIIHFLLSPYDYKIHGSQEASYYSRELGYAPILKAGRSPSSELWFFNSWDLGRDMDFLPE